jgi:hypothetical protein
MILPSRSNRSLIGRHEARKPLMVHALSREFAHRVMALCAPKSEKLIFTNGLVAESGPLSLSETQSG